LAQFVNKNINTLLVKLAGMVFGGFGGLALFLAVVGVYGVKSHMVGRRTHEIGIRLALGGRPNDVIALIMKQGILQTSAGLGLGIALAIVAGRALSGMLYEVDSADVLALLGSAVVLAVSTLIACWIPARRATKVDPMIALRNE
jgi:putative ABC transport system permease protein